MDRQLTTPIDPTQTVIGYIINSGLSVGFYRELRGIQERLMARFPGAIWIPPRDSLHITLMDWSAPLVDYGRDKDELFRKLEPRYTEVLNQSLAGQSPIPVSFGTLEVHPAAVIVKGRDDGSYQRIRSEFLQRVELLPGTKLPPKIVHTTIAKFLAPIGLAEIEDFLGNEMITFQEMITEFRLTRETQIFLSKYAVLRRFALH